MYWLLLLKLLLLHFSLFLHLHGGHSLLFDLHFLLMNLLLVLDFHLFLLSKLDFHQLLRGRNIMLLDGNSFFFFLDNLMVRFFMSSCVSLSFWNSINWLWDSNLGSLSNGAHVVSVQSSQELIMFNLVGHLLLESSIFGNGSLVEGLLLAHILVLDLVEDFIDSVLLILWHDVLGELVASLLWMHIFRILLDISLIILGILVGVGNYETTFFCKSGDKVSICKNLSLIFWSTLHNTK